MCSACASAGQIRQVLRYLPATFWIQLQAFAWGKKDYAAAVIGGAYLGSQHNDYLTRARLLRMIFQTQHPFHPAPKSSKLYKTRIFTKHQTSTSFKVMAEPGISGFLAIFGLYSLFIASLTAYNIKYDTRFGSPRVIARDTGTQNGSTPETRQHSD